MAKRKVKRGKPHKWKADNLTQLAKVSNSDIDDSTHRWQNIRGLTVNVVGLKVRVKGIIDPFVNFISAKGKQ